MATQNIEAAASEVQKEKKEVKLIHKPIIDDTQDDGTMYEYPKKKKQKIIPGKMSELEIPVPGPIQAMPETLHTLT